MDRVLTEEQAVEALEKAVKCFDADLKKDDKAALKKGFVSGRLIFNEKDESFTVYLIKPIELENGEKIGSINISEPTFEQLEAAGKSTNQFEQAIDLISNMSGIGKGIIRRLKMRDLNLFGAVMGFFG